MRPPVHGPTKITIAFDQTTYEKLLDSAIENNQTAGGEAARLIALALAGRSKSSAFPQQTKDQRKRRRT